MKFEFISISFYVFYVVFGMIFIWNNVFIIVGVL